MSSWFQLGPKSQETVSGAGSEQPTGLAWLFSQSHLKQAQPLLAGSLHDRQAVYYRVAPGSRPLDVVQQKNSSFQLKFLFREKQNKEKKRQFQRRRVPIQKGGENITTEANKAIEVHVGVGVRARTMHVLLK